MSAFQISEKAARRLEEIYNYTIDVWGTEQADEYLLGLFERFQAIADKSFPWRPIPAPLAVDGFVCRYEKHFIYWMILPNDDVGIVAILHERLHRTRRFLEDFEGGGEA